METQISRRSFLSRSLAAGAAIGLTKFSSIRLHAANELPEPSAKKLPRWQGFNLLEKFNGRNDRFKEDAFE